MSSREEPGYGTALHEYSDADEDDEPHDRTPLISGTAQHKDPTDTGYGLYKSRLRWAQEARY